MVSRGSATLILGAQWGDEGKGKVTDVLARRADVVARFQGGNNAGHTIVIQGKTFKLHHLPAAVLHPEKLAVIGNGVVIDPPALLKELRDQAELGMPVRNLRISDRAHAILPWHQALDGAREAGTGAVGSTKRGIGPAYSDKAARDGLRMAELISPEAVQQHVHAHLRYQRARIAALGGPGAGQALDEADIVRRFQGYGRDLKPFVTDTAALLHDALDQGKRILLEGAQGTLLDLDHGTYPFVTSSSTTAGGACTGTGLPPRAIGEVLAVVKAYTTRVGLGPFPTELKDAVGEHLGTVGKEVGTTTGRRRRCGWLDLVLLRYAARLNGFTGLAITKLDVLGGLQEVKVATHYTMDGKELHHPPSLAGELARATPAYKAFRGWAPLTEADVGRVAQRGLGELPPQAQEYLDFLAKALGVPLRMVSIGPGREDTVEVAA